MLDWKRLAPTSPGAMTRARRQLHWAVQLAAAPGASLLEAAADFSHTSLEWIEAESALAGRPVGAPGRTVRTALRPSDLNLLALDDDGQRTMALPLDGKTTAEGLTWIRHAIREVTGTPPDGPLARPDHPMPPHEIEDGAPFARGDVETFVELGHWFSNADRLLRELAKRTEGATPVRCWPHHLDIATLIVLEPNEDPETARSVGAGLSPGDGAFDEPYFYVSPYPSNPSQKAPDLAGGGFWNREGFFSALLTADRLVDGPPSAQSAQVSGYLHSAVEACFTLINKRPARQ